MPRCWTGDKPSPKPKLTDFYCGISSIGRVFRPPLRRAAQNGGPSASGRHLGWPHFRFPQMRSSKMATRSGRAAILRRAPQWGSKNSPQVLDDVISAAAILDPRWRRWKWRLEDVETPVKTSYRRLPHPWVMSSCRSLTLLRFKKHLIVSLTQALSKWLSELPACYYAEVISLHMSKVVKNLRLQQAPTLHFFLDFILSFF